MSIIVHKTHDDKGRKRFNIYSLAAEANAEDGLIKVNRSKKAFSDDFEWRVDADTKGLNPDQLALVISGLGMAKAIIDGDEKAVTSADKAEKWLGDLKTQQEKLAKVKADEAEKVKAERMKHMAKRLGELQKKSNGKAWVVDLHVSGEGFSVINCTTGEFYGRECFATYKKAQETCAGLLDGSITPKAEKA